MQKLHIADSDMSVVFIIVTSMNNECAKILCGKAYYGDR